MADGRGTLVSIESLDEFWFPCFAAAIEPLVSAGITCVWHCDGNLSQMIPRLIEAGVSGFQGFQYEYHMDYEAICRMKSRDGQPLLIIGGVSVTTTLPKGTPADVKREMEWLVRHAPPVGFLLGCSSSITPGVPWDHLKTLIEGFHYYRTHGHTGGVAPFGLSAVSLLWLTLPCDANPRHRMRRLYRLPHDPTPPSGRPHGGRRGQSQLHL